LLYGEAVFEEAYLLTVIMGGTIMLPVQKSWLFHCNSAHKTASFLCIALLIFTAGNLHATVATQIESERVSENWLTYVVNQTGDWAGETYPDIASIEDVLENGRLIGRCCHIDPVGYILVPIIKELPPIKLYSEDCNIDFDQPGLAQMIKEILIHRLNLYLEHYGSLEATQDSKDYQIFSESHRKEWDQYLKSPSEFMADFGKGTLADMQSVGPLLTSLWHQDWPFNLLCPPGDGGQCKVGCTATAASQIMHYYQCPPSGVGEHYYEWTGDSSCGSSTASEHLYANFSDPYDWANMPDEVNYSASQEVIAAVSELCYEVGVAFEMDYGYCGSGIWQGEYPIDVIPSYIDHFRFQPGIGMELRSDWDYASNWFNYVIKPEIDAGRPMQYSITGHSFVCDGWSESGGIYYHMNYGWGGSQNGWYAVDDYYCPDDCYPSHEFVLRYLQPLPDYDGDGLLNAEDNCPITPNFDQADADCDGFGDACDNCDFTQNPDQGDADEDGDGDYCDPDADDDGYLNENDNCWLVADSDTTDTDGDGVGDPCDNCPDDYNVYQYNEDLDQWGDACDGGFYFQCCLDMPPAYVGEPYSYQFWAVSGTEPYEWEKLVGSLPGSMTLESDGLFHGTAPSWEWIYGLKIRVTDQAAHADTMWVYWEIVYPPEPPEMESIDPQTVFPDSNLNFMVLADDPNGTSPRLIAESYPENCTFVDYCDGTGEFDFNPTEAQIGMHTVTFIASDGELADTQVVNINVTDMVCGDADASGDPDIDDVVYLIAYIFSGGPAPVPYESGDANCAGGVDIDDVVYLIAYIFSGGPAPCDPDGDEVPDC
jgi:hypothetical protein